MAKAFRTIFPFLFLGILATPVLLVHGFGEGARLLVYGAALWIAGVALKGIAYIVAESWSQQSYLRWRDPWGYTTHCVIALAEFLPLVSVAYILAERTKTDFFFIAGLAYGIGWAEAALLYMVPERWISDHVRIVDSNNAPLGEIQSIIIGSIERVLALAMHTLTRTALVYSIFFGPVWAAFAAIVPFSIMEAEGVRITSGGKTPLIRVAEYYVLVALLIIPPIFAVLTTFSRTQQ